MIILILSCVVVLCVVIVAVVTLLTRRGALAAVAMIPIMAQAALSRKAGGAPAKKCAWVTLVMIGDAYIPGALALASSLRSVGTEHSIAIMVTKDVSEKARKALAVLFTDVLDVDYIVKPTTYPRSEKQKKIYSWVDKSLTKWNCTRFTQWAKVIFVDADIVFRQNADDLFELKAPAGCFSTPWAYPYVHGKGRAGIKNPYIEWYRRKSKNRGARDIPHGTLLPSEVLQKALTQPTFTLLGAVVLLEPSAALFDNVMKTVKMDDPKSVYGTGHAIVANTAEEAAIVDATASRGVSWTHIHQKYEWVPRKPDWYHPKNSTDVRAYHFLGAHPWAMDRHAWPDVASWWEEADKLAAEHPELAEWFKGEVKAAPPKAEGEGKTGGAAAKAVRIVVKLRDAGVYLDALVTAAALRKAGYEPDIVVSGELRDRSDPLAHVPLQIWIEHSTGRREGRFPAEREFVIVNHEFITEWDLQDLMEGVPALCKTHAAAKRMKALGVPSVAYIGFTSPEAPEADPRTGTPLTKDPTLAVHLAGTSILKNTAAVLKAALECPEFASDGGYTLVVTRAEAPFEKPRKSGHGAPTRCGDLDAWRAARPQKGASLKVGEREIPGFERVGNIYLCTGRLAAGDIEELVARAGIDLCPSAMEGFGHIINRGRLAGSVVITADAPPMNELVDEKCGLLVPTTAGASVRSTMPWLHLVGDDVKLAMVTSADIVGALRRAFALSVGNRLAMGAAARDRALNERRAFEAALGLVLDSACPPLSP